MVAPTTQPAPVSPPPPPPEAETTNLPPLTDRQAELLVAYIQNNYNLNAIAQPGVSRSSSAPPAPNTGSSLCDSVCSVVSPAEVLAFTTSPAVQAYLKAHFEFLHGVTKCKATEARQFALAELRALAEESGDPREKRIILQTLMRATTAPIVPAGNARECASRQPERSSQGGRSGPSRSQVEESQDGLPRLKTAPRERMPAYYLRSIVTDALRTNDHPDEDSGLATIAEFMEADAEIDGEPVPGDDCEESLQVVRDSNLARLVNCGQFTHHDSKRITDEHWTESFVACTAHGQWSLHMEIRQGGPASRYPGHFLITSIKTAPCAKPP